MAHIGAIDALKARHVKIDCVYGNSMGAVVGSLYAADPARDLKQRYQELIGQYVRATAEVKTGSTTVRSLLEGVRHIIRTGGGWSEILDALTAELREALFSDTFDNARFQRVLDADLHGATIESLPVKFATSYQTVRSQGLELGIVTRGNVAEAVSRSANNPFIFRKTSLRYLDPGSDRVAAVPIEDACSLNLGARIIAINVAGEPSHYHKDLGCTVHEVVLSLDATPPDAIRGEGVEFDKVYAQGFQAASDLAAQLSAPDAGTAAGVPRAAL
jgi:NTE family protein